MSISLALARGVLDRLRDRRVERVGDVLDDQAERAGAPVAQRAREVVAGEAQRRDRASTRAAVAGAHAGLAVDDARDRLQADARAAATSRMVGLAALSSLLLLDR